MTKRMKEPTKDKIREDLASAKKQLHDAVSQLATFRNLMQEQRLRLITVGTFWGLMTFFAGVLVGRIS